MTTDKHSRYENTSYKLWGQLPIVACDTEYDSVTKIPFLATTTDEQLQCKVYRLENPTEYKQFKQICENPKIIKVWHQCTADMYVLANIDIQIVKPYEDTMIMASLLCEGYAKIGLKALARMFLGDKTKTQKTLKSVYNVMKKKDSTVSWKDIPLDVMIPYAKDDPLFTIKLFYLWKKAIKKYWELYNDEKTLIPIIVRMEQNGYIIDRKFVMKQHTKYVRGMEESTNIICKILAKENIECDVEGFNPGSPKQLTSALLSLGAPLTIENKTGFSTNAEVLQELAVAKKVVISGGHRELVVPKIVNEFVKHILDFRFFKKHLSTYYKPLLERYTTPKNHIAHFSFYQSGTKTGRFSAELLQTFPRTEESRRSGHTHEVRKCVMVKTGERIVCIDMDQMELRLFAHFSKADRLIKAFEKGIDPYVQISRDLFSQSLMEESKELFKALRWIGKKIVLGIIFGMGKNKMVWTLLYELPNVASQKAIKKIGMTRQKGEEILNKFHSMYPVREHSNALQSEIHKTGELQLNVDSPILHIHRAYRIPNRLSYKGINVEIQGTAAYVIKEAMRRISKRLQKPIYTNRNVRMIGTVHDELKFYMRDDSKLPIIINNLIKDIEDIQSFRVPLTASAKTSTVSWGEVVDYK